MNECLNFYSLLIIYNQTGVAQIEATFTDSAEGYISHIIHKRIRRKYPIIVMEKLSGRLKLINIYLHLST